MITELYKGFGWINDTGADIEPGSALELKDSIVQENEIFFHVKKPTIAGIAKRLIYFNAPVLVPDGGAGRFQVGPIFIVAKNGAINIGDLVGPVAAQWYVATGSGGYSYLGDDPTGVFTNCGVIAAVGSVKKLFVTTSTITAATGTSSPFTPGTGTGTMMEFYDASGTVKTQTTGITGVTLKHHGSQSIASGRVVQAEYVDGFWLIDVDYC